MRGKRVVEEISASDDQKERFLKAYAVCKDLKQAAAAAGTTEAKIRRWRRSDPEFGTEVDEIEMDLADRLEQKAISLAIDGLQKPVFYKGEIVGYETVFPTTLQIFLLKKLKPDKYGDHVISSGDQVIKLKY